jgi:hypothetical protein
VSRILFVSSGLSHEGLTMNLEARSRMQSVAFACALTVLTGCGGGSREKTDVSIPASNIALAATESCRRGDVRLAEGDLVSARSEYDKAIAADPQCPEALCGRGRARRRMGDTAGARSDLDAALKAASGVLLRSARPGGTSPYADRERALAMSRLMVDIYAVRGVLRESGGDAAGANEDFNEARRINAALAEETMARERGGVNPR